MKKNLRIVSAAAAALLAVAPVAASAVNVNAEVANLGAADTNTQSTDTSKINVKVTLQDENGKDIKMGANISDAKKATVTATQNGKTLSTKVTGNVSVTADSSNTGDATSKFEKLGSYHVTVNGLQITGLTTSETGKYAATGKGVFGGDGLTNNDVTAGNLEHGVTYTDSFKIYDTESKATPTFVNAKSNTQIPANGTAADIQSATDGETVSSILQDAEHAVSFQEDGNTITTTADDVKDQLKSQKISISNDNKISLAEGKGFIVTLTGRNDTSGKTTTVKIGFKRAAEDVIAKSPIVYLYTNGDANAANPVEPTPAHGVFALQQGTKSNPLNQTNVPNMIAVSKSKDKDQFKPTHYFRASVDTQHQNIWTNDFTVKANNVDLSTSGVYSVTVSAKNNAGYTTDVTVPVVVYEPANNSADKNAEVAKIVNTPGFPVTVYNVMGDSVVKSANNYDFLYNGHNVLTYETKTIDGKSYTRITDTEKTDLWNNKNAWVESDKLSNFQESKTSVKIMHSAKVYNEKHEATGKENKHAYNMVEVVADESGQPKNFTIGKDVPAYKLADGSGYIDSRNVTATLKKLNHNSYVYKSNGKVRTYKKTVKKGKKHVKVTRRVLKKKGTTVNTYGAAFNIKGHKMFRIGVNEYIKVANFE